MIAAAGVLIACGLAYALFWALVIFPSFAALCGAVAVAAGTYFVLRRVSVSDKRIAHSIEKERQRLGY